MNDIPGPGPAGIHATSGIIHARSLYPVGETVAKLTGAINAAGATLFALVDHSGEAARAGLSLRDTKLLIFGNPVGGTPVMVASPLAAIDLPLKILVWQDDEDAVWTSYLDPAWLASRHGLSPELLAPLHAAGKLASQVASAPVPGEA